MQLTIEGYEAKDLKIGKVLVSDAKIEEVLQVLSAVGLTGRVVINTPEGVQRLSDSIPAPHVPPAPKPAEKVAPVLPLAKPKSSRAEVEAGMDELEKPAPKPEPKKAEPKKAEPKPPPPPKAAKPAEQLALATPAATPAAKANGTNGHAAEPAPAGNGEWDINVIKEKKRARDIVVYLIGCGIKDPDQLVDLCQKLAPEVAVLERVPDLAQRVRDLAAAIEA